MSFHNKPEYNIPAIVEGLQKHGLEHDTPSQLSDAFRHGFRHGFVYADRAQRAAPGVQGLTELEGRLNLLFADLGNMRRNFGDVGSRDVDVAAWNERLCVTRKAIHEALLALDAAAHPPQQSVQPVAWMREDELNAMTNDEKQAWIAANRKEVVSEYTKPLIHAAAQPVKAQPKKLSAEHPLSVFAHEIALAVYEESSLRERAKKALEWAESFDPVEEVQPAQVEALDDLVTLVRRLVHALHKAAPQHDLTAQALDYLQRKGFDKGPLRSASAVLSHGIKPTSSEGGA